MIDYKKTLNLLSSDFPMKADLPSKEPSFLRFWLDNKIYEKRLIKNKECPQYILHDGPPYANGSIHLGHALNKILKDIVVRYRNMNYYSSPFIPGWDTHGLPVEHAVYVKNKSKWSQLNATEQRTLCKQYAEEQIEIQREQFRKLGLLTDFVKCYYTFDPDYEVQQLYVFLEMVKKDLVYFSEKPVYWSWSSHSALAQAEVEYKEVSAPSIFVQFHLSEKKFTVPNTSIIVWTTTPWTIPSNRAVSVHPDVDYALFTYRNHNYIVANELLGKICREFGWDGYKVVKILKGADLVGVEYTHPLYDFLCPIICDEYVSVVDGTGLVHNAPGFGVEDYLVCKKYNIPVFCPIDADGKFTTLINDPQLSGLFYEDANDIIKQRLQTKQLLLKSDYITHRVAHDWRTHKPVIFRATKQWFVNLDGVKKNLVKNFSTIDFLVDRNQNQLYSMLTNRQEWCISRQRVWGVPIPIIFDQNGEPILDPKLIKYTIDKLAEIGTDAWFEKPVSVFLSPEYKHLKNARKCIDIFDVWFDSGVSFNVFVRENHVYPADLYLEGADQFRGWFNSSYINGCIINGKPPYKMIFATGFTVDENGNKMSKSIGNVISPQSIGDRYGYDVLRLLVANSEYFNDIRVGQLVIDQVVEIYRRIRNSLFRFTLGNLVDFDFRKINLENLTFSEKVMLNSIHNDLEKIDKCYQSYDFYTIVKLINKNIIDYSSWYFETIKDCLYCDEKNSQSRINVQTVLYYLLMNYLIRLAPILPYTCEEVFGYIKMANKPESVHLLNWNDFSFDKFAVDEQGVFAYFNKLRERVNSAVEQKRQTESLGKINSLQITIFAKEFPKWCTGELLSQWFTVASVECVKASEPSITVKVSDFTKCERCWRYFDKQKMQKQANRYLCARCAKIVTKSA